MSTTMACSQCGCFNTCNRLFFEAISRWCKVVVVDVAHKSLRYINPLPSSISSIQIYWFSNSNSFDANVKCAFWAFPSSFRILFYHRPQQYALKPIWKKWTYARSKFDRWVKSAVTIIAMCVKLKFMHKISDAIKINDCTSDTFMMRRLF